jgi:uncharacterized cupredoxin-like copper-binding protein
VSEQDPEAGPAPTEPATTATSDPGTAAGTAGGAVAVALGEWFVDAPASVAPGAQTFSAANVGQNVHALAVARGDSYEALPLLDNGAVDVESLATDFLGRTGNLAPGESAEIEVDLEAGGYVLFCPIQLGQSAHAALGQVRSVSAG